MKAFLVVDMLVDFIDPKGALYIGPVAEKLVKEVKARLDEHRAAGNPVFFICDHHLEDDKEFKMFPPHSLEGSGGSQVVAELAPQDGERVVYKRRFSGFFGTDLDLSLREKEISAIEIAGCLTNICVLYSSADARALNYQVTVYEKAVASSNQDAHHFALKELKNTLGVNLI